MTEPRKTPRPGPPRRRKRAFAVPAAIAAIATIAVVSTQQFQGDDSPATSPTESDAEVIVATLDNVTDGDTIRVTLDGQSERVRILGLDAPEVHTSRDCGGTESWDHLDTLLSKGEEVSLIADNSQSLYDQYGRMLAYVENSDGTDVGNAQIEAGWARVYRAGSRIERFGTYVQTETEARSENRGIWGHC